MNSISQPVIEGWVYVDLAPYVSESGGMGSDGYSGAWNIIASAPVAVPIRINLGKLKYLDVGLIRQHFGDITKASKIEVQGEEPRAIRVLVNELTALIEGGWGTKTDWWRKTTRRVAA